MLIPAHCRRSRSGNELQIEKMVGRTMVVSGNTPMAQQGRCCRASASQTMTLIVTLLVMRRWLLLFGMRLCHEGFKQLARPHQWQEAQPCLRHEHAVPPLLLPAFKRSPLSTLSTRDLPPLRPPVQLQQPIFITLAKNTMKTSETGEVIT
jgi:hypothetical protein